MSSALRRRHEEEDQVSTHGQPLWNTLSREESLQMGSRKKLGNFQAESDCLHHAFYEDILRFIEKEREQVRERETQVEGDGNRSE